MSATESLDHEPTQPAGEAQCIPGFSRNMHISFVAHGHHFMEDVTARTFSRLTTDAKALIGVGLVNDARFSFLHGHPEAQLEFIHRIINKCLDQPAQIDRDAVVEKLNQLTESGLSSGNELGFELTELGMKFLKENVRRGVAGKLTERKKS